MESKLRKIPTVKKIEGQEIVVASDLEKDIYHEIEETKKKELIINRDEW